MLLLHDYTSFEVLVLVCVMLLYMLSIKVLVL